MEQFEKLLNSYIELHTANGSYLYNIKTAEARKELLDILNQSMIKEYNRGESFGYKEGHRIGYNQGTKDSYEEAKDAYKQGYWDAIDEN